MTRKSVEEREERARDFVPGILGDIKQLRRLLELKPPIDNAEIAHRMALKPRELRRLFQLLRIKR